MIVAIIGAVATIAGAFVGGKYAVEAATKKPTDPAVPKPTSELSFKPSESPKTTPEPGSMQPKAWIPYIKHAGGTSTYSIFSYEVRLQYATELSCVAISSVVQAKNGATFNQITSPLEVDKDDWSGKRTRKFKDPDTSFGEWYVVIEVKCNGNSVARNQSENYGDSG